MNKAFWGILLITLMIMLMVSQAFAQPKMFLPEEKFDFGFVPQNAKVTHIFWIKSVGDDTLKILSIKPG